MQCKLAIICQLSQRTAQRKLTAGFAVSSCVDVFSSTAIVAEVAVVVGAPMSVCVCVRARVCACVRACVRVCVCVWTQLQKESYSETRRHSCAQCTRGLMPATVER